MTRSPDVDLVVVELEVDLRAQELQVGDERIGFGEAPLVGAEVPRDGLGIALLHVHAGWIVTGALGAKVVLRLTKPARAVIGTKRIRVVAVQTADGADAVSTKFWLRRK